MEDMFDAGQRKLALERLVDTVRDAEGDEDFLKAAEW